MAKVIGADIVAFFDSEWPEEWYVDDGTLTCFEGKIINDADRNTYEGLPLSDKYDLAEFGELMSSSQVTEPPSLATFFNRWKKAQTTVTLLVDVPKEEREQALVVFAARGWKVINR
jgi:hypothetical protein